MLKRIVLFLLLVLSVQFAAAVYAIPANDGRLIRVGISSSNFSNYYFNTIDLTATNTFRLVDKCENSVIADFGANEPVTVKIKDNLFDIYQKDTEIASGLIGPVSVESQEGFVTVVNLKRASKPAFYRGTFEITKAPKKDNQFNVINIIDLESYLRGVVPNEMPVRFGLEPLKAQAVLARNYALKPREANYHNFDVCDSVACQVYFGANTEQPLSDRAIVETENIIAMSGEDLILALYSSTAGGYTENFENAFSVDLAGGIRMFPGIPKTYLKGIPDNKDTPVLNTEEAARDFYTSTPDTFDNKSPYFRWKREWDIKELENVLQKTLIAQSAAGFVKPKLEKSEDFGKLKDITVTKRGVSGKAMSIDITTDKGVFTIQKELPIRRAFQKNNVSLPSANFVIDINEVKPENPKMPPAKQILLTGGGFGHGVGMSQYGAGAMGEKGYSYAEIIQHYYNGTAICTYPVVLSNQTGEDTAVQTFYTTEKKASLVIENKFQFSKLTVVINGQELRLEVVPRLFRVEKFDISNFMVEGKNKITYIMPYSELHKKPVKIYLELKEAKYDN